MLALGARRSDRRKLDLRESLAGIAELVRPSLAPHHRLQVHLPDHPVEAVVDPSEIMQILLNLLVNARDALDRDAPGFIHLRLCVRPPAGAGRVFIVGSPPNGQTAWIRVSDNGSGISRGDLDRIFAPYFSRKGDGGTGLGLAVVARIVTDAGGGIAVHSRPGRGSVFDVAWPLDPPVFEPRQAPGATLAAGASLAGETILLVDDNTQVVAVLADLLEKAGAEVGPCDNPQDALAALGEDPDAWSLLITDYDMPHLTGAELARAARALKPGLPILLCTALPEAHRGRVGDRSLFNGVIGKPVTVEGLVSAARAAIDTMALMPAGYPKDSTI